MLARRVEAGADVPRIAELVATALHDAGLALAPIVGTGGFTALCARSLYVTAATRPWLADVREGVHDGIDLPRLRAAIGSQGSDEAAAGGGDLLQTFHDLLASLIGASLTQRLLRPAWAPLMSGPAAQDTSP